MKHLVLTLLGLTATACYASAERTADAAAGTDAVPADAFAADASAHDECDGAPAGAVCEADGECDGAGHCLHILANVMSPQGITVDGSFVAFTAGSSTAEGTVMRCEARGCEGGPVTLAMHQIVPLDIVASSDHHLFWIGTNLDGFGEGSLAMVPTDGSAVATTFYADRPYPGGVAVDGSRVYFCGDDGVRSCPQTGCAAGITMEASTTDHPTHVVVVGRWLVWTALTEPSSPEGLVMRCAIGACVPERLSSGPRDSLGLATDGTYVYWTDARMGAVLRCAADGCASPTVLASGLDVPAALATDGTTVYFSTTPMGDGAVYACPATGCASPTLVATGPRVFSPGSIAIDAHDVYWTDFNTHVVVRTRRR